MNYKYLFQDSPYPPKLAKQIFEKGLTYVLDSFAYGDSLSFSSVMRENRDMKNDITKYEHKDTPSYQDFNDARLIIHSRDDFPMFFARDVKPITLMGESKIKDYAKEFSLPFEVTLKSSDETLREYNIETRKCMFSEEHSRLEFFDHYSEVSSSLTLQKPGFLSI